MKIGLFDLAVASLAAGIEIAMACAAHAETRSDEWITTKMSVALYSIDEIDPRDINVDSRGGRLTLAGTVPTFEAQQKVVAVARQVEGVRDINDELHVAPPPPDAAPRAHFGTDDLRGDVVKRLANDRELRDNSISVTAHPDGVVVLGGFADSLTAQLRALQIASGVNGVERVRNEMKSPPGALYDILPAEGAASGTDARNRRERQALDGRAAEPIPGQAGDAPYSGPPGVDSAADINPEGDTTHSPRGEDVHP
jgi:hyperosmotically inducible protein